MRGAHSADDGFIQPVSFAEAGHRGGTARVANIRAGTTHRQLVGAQLSLLQDAAHDRHALLTTLLAVTSSGLLCVASQLDAELPQLMAALGAADAGTARSRLADLFQLLDIKLTGDEWHGPQHGHECTHAQYAMLKTMVEELKAALLLWASEQPRQSRQQRRRLG